MGPKNAPVIIIRKKRPHSAHGHHGGAWKVAYADFVTAMMAFFLVMWIVNQRPEVKAAIAGYFRNPGLFEHEQSTSFIPGGQPGIDPESPAKLREEEAPVPGAADAAALGQTAKRIQEALAKMPEFAELRDQVSIEVTSEGLRIQLIEASDSSFFDSGSAVLKGESERILALIAAELGKLRNAIVFEGYTDSRRYTSSERYTNWELSVDRANAARRVMQQAGVMADQIREVRGYADTRLRVPDAPLDPRNRRVSITVKAGTVPSGSD